MDNNFQLDIRLKNDTVLLSNRKNFIILLHKNASIPWIIIVPKTEVVEVFDLPEDMQGSLNMMTKRISAYFKEQYNSEKMNIAAIGNIVSQLHIHVISRKEGDACWPDVVWGNKYVFTKYSQAHIDSIIRGVTFILDDLHQQNVEA